MALDDIAVGLDGSEGSSAALRWAADLAKATSASVRAVSTWQMPLIASMPPVIGGLPSQAFMANHCAERLDTALAQAGIDYDIEAVVREGDPGVVLAAETEIADLVVVGRTGSGRRHGVSRVAEMILGSAARYCIHHAKGPVAAVPLDQPWVANPTVVVGVDGSASSHAALAWAVENLPATAKIYALRAVPPYLEGVLAIDPDVLTRVLAATDQELDESITSALAHLDPEAVRRVQPLVLVESARYALAEPGFDVDLVVVGERGRNPIAARMLGSISDHVVRRSKCPVIVVPTPQESD